MDVLVDSCIQFLHNIHSKLMKLQFQESKYGRNTILTAGTLRQIQSCWSGTVHDEARQAFANVIKSGSMILFGVKKS